jgi:hypothetical protein
MLTYGHVTSGFPQLASCGPAALRLSGPPARVPYRFGYGVTVIVATSLCDGAKFAVPRNTSS